jgi:uncharacterized ferritin-like protein (DUF455 family)
VSSEGAATDLSSDALTGSLTGWAWAYVTTPSLAHKLAPPPLPAALGAERAAPERPGRPPELAVEARARKAPRSLARAEKRAELAHTFFHHELQAAELMCWAILRFPDAPEAFRRGLARIALDEVRHLNLYAAHVERLGARLGGFPVRDWFWERVPRAETPAAFVALLGVGFEGGNLDHTRRFADALRAAGDAALAATVEEVGADEVAHVRFALRWLEAFAGPVSFERWAALLPAPLSPAVLRGTPMDRDARLRAGMAPEFLDRLAASAV